MSDTQKLTPWQRIMRNAERGIGVRLSAEDVYRLSRDDAIATRALLDDENNRGISDDKVGLGFDDEAWKHV